MGKKGCNLGLMFNNADIANDRTFLDYYYRLIELAVDRYEWINLPPSIDERFLELTLLNDGMAVFFLDEVLGFLALQVRIGGPLDVYRIPTRRTAYSVSGYHNDLSINDSVIIFNNYLRMPSLFSIINYCWRLYDIQRTIDVNVKAQKTPFIIRASQQQQLSVKNAYEQFNGNQPAIMADKNFDVDSIKVLPTEAPFVADKLQQLKTQVWNEALTFLGIESVENSKRERLITNEVEASMGAVDAQRFTGLNARRQAAKQINEMFGLDIQVEFRQEVRKEDLSSVQVYNDDTLVD